MKQNEQNKIGIDKVLEEDKCFTYLLKKEI